MQRTENHKKFRINCRKDAIKSFEFICEILETMQNASRCEPESLKNLEQALKYMLLKDSKR